MAELVCTVTYTLHRKRVVREGKEGSEGQNHKEEEREGESVMGWGRGRS